MNTRHPNAFSVLSVLLAALVITTGAVTPAHAEDRREVEGRALFAKGEYQGALDVYANLFAEKGDPLYLRNVGRCYQKLKRPEKAIDAFHEYLRRAKVKPREREEVEGFIKEMQELQSQQAAAAPVQPPPPLAPPKIFAPVEPPPPAAPLPNAAAGAPGASLTVAAGAGDHPSEEPTPLTHRWWFWAGLGTLVAGGVVAALVLSSGGHTAVIPPCQAPAECPP